MSGFGVELVAVEARFWEGRATFVSATTTEGEIGIYAGHQPLLAELAGNGVVKIIDTDGKTHIAAVAGGFLSVTGTLVTVLAESARWASDVNVDDAQRRLAEAEEKKLATEADRARGELRAAARL